MRRQPGLDAMPRIAVSSKSILFAALEFPTDLLQRRVRLTIASTYLPSYLVADQLWQVRLIDAGFAVELQDRVKDVVHASEFGQQ
jgi:hypothetical protein